MNKKQIIIIIIAALIAIIVVFSILMNNAPTESEINNSKDNVNSAENMDVREQKAKTFYEENKDKITITEDESKGIAETEVQRDNSDKGSLNIHKVSSDGKLRVYEDSNGKLRLAYWINVHGTYASYNSPNPTSHNNNPLYESLQVDAITGETFTKFHWQTLVNKTD